MEFELHTIFFFREATYMKSIYLLPFIKKKNSTSRFFFEGTTSRIGPFEGTTSRIGPNRL